VNTLTNLQPQESFTSHEYDAHRNYLHELWFLCKPNGFEYAIFDAHHKEIHLFNSYQVADFFNIGAKTLSGFLDHIELFLNDFKNIKVVFENPNYTLMPSPLFDEAEALSCYNLKYTLGESEKLLHKRIADFGAHVIYAVPSFMFNNLIAKFTDSSLREHVKVYHHIHALLSGLYYQTYHLNKEICYINLCEKSFDIILIKNSKLHFCNTYPYHNPEDILYFVMHTYQSNLLQPDNHECYLIGTNPDKNIISGLLNDYLKNIFNISLYSLPTDIINPSTIFLLQYCV